MWYFIGMLVNDEICDDFEAVGLANKSQFLLQTNKEVLTMRGSSTGLTFRARHASNSVFERCKIQFKVVSDDWSIKVIKYCDLHNLYVCKELYMADNINFEFGWKDSIILHKLTIAQIFMITCFKFWTRNTLSRVTSIYDIKPYKNNEMGIQYIIITDIARCVCTLIVDENYMKRLYAKLKILGYLR